MTTSTFRLVRIAAWVAVVLISGILVWTFISPKQNPASSIAAATIGGPFALTDQKGATVTEAALQGHPSALFFGYTFCPDVCPTTLSDLSVWLQELGPYGDRLKVYFISIDPARDTPTVLADYLQAFDPRIEGLSGSQAAVDQIVKDYRVYVNKVPGDQGSYTFDHTATVYLLDANAKLTGTVDDQEDPAVALEKLKRLVGIAVS
jgi:protein SCO1